MNFQEIKIIVIGATQLDKDALHIYVGMSVYLLSLLITHPIIKRPLPRQIIALIFVTIAAFMGEYLDLQGNITNISEIRRAASVHDLINTCLLPYTLFVLQKLTPIFRS